ncbi:MAG TPA: glycoside hydrolase family 43 protein [Polyangiaceae bacterium]
MAIYRNPILPGFHPDPSICRVGRDFYLATSSFEYFPGVPLFHSRDLVHWQPIGHALTRPSQLNLDGVPSSGGIYAPTLRHFRGRFFMVTTHVNGGGNFYVTAKNARGPWSDPVRLDEGGIDPSIDFADGTAWYTRNGKGKDFDHPEIHQAPFDLKKGAIVGPVRPVWPGTGGIWPEGPHLYKMGATYYLLTAEGGTGYEHSIVVGRSASPSGPFEPCPFNPILTHRDSPRHPIQATGHADFVELDDGTTWAVLLGIRPTGGRHHHLGRETFLAPVTFTKDGWPRIGERGRVELRMRGPSLPRHPFPSPPVRDDFDARDLSPTWSMLRNPEPGSISLARRRGFLRLAGTAVTLDEVGAPAFVGRRQEHFRVACRAALEFEPRGHGEEAGLTVRANERFHYDLAVGLGREGRTATLRASTRAKTRNVARVTLRPGPLVLELRATEERYAFAVRTGQRRLPLGELPTRGLSAETVGAGGPNYFTGAFIGLYATGNGAASTASADFDWFDYEPGR